MRYNPKKHHLPPFDASGILLVDKPAQWTSFDVVNFVRSRFNIPKVGHCGTLDPAATGLLVLVLGSFTAYSGKLSGDDKSYFARLQIGLETDSGDLDGEVVAEKDCSGVTDDRLRATVMSFVGDQLQTPPMVSAAKVNGKKLYELARKGIEIEREPRPITISSIDIASCRVPFCEFTLVCSKGTYVRTLCTDIGAKLGCGGVLAGLRRLRSGRFILDHAVTVDRLKELDQDGLAQVLAEQLTQMAKESGK